MSDGKEWLTRALPLVYNLLVSGMGDSGDETSPPRAAQKLFMTGSYCLHDIITFVSSAVCTHGPSRKCLQSGRHQSHVSGRPYTCSNLAGNAHSNWLLRETYYQRYENLSMAHSNTILVCFFSTPWKPHNRSTTVRFECYHCMGPCPWPSKVPATTAQDKQKHVTHHSGQ